MLLQEKINPTRLILLALISSVLLWLAWPPIPFNFVVFIALVPLLAVEDNISRFYKRRFWTVFLFSYITFTFWNLFTTYWIWYASHWAIFAIAANALFMTITFTLFFAVKRRGGRILGYISLICFWLSFEMLHLNWDAPWPWLNIGNVFGAMPNWVQWYEYTGVLGGTVWVWAVNILIYEGLRQVIGDRGQGIEKQSSVNSHQISEKKNSFRLLYIALGVIVVPVVISYSIKPKNDAPTGKANMVAVQPNIDPYLNKFDPATYASQINTLISLSEGALDSNTVAIAWPETAIAEDVNEQSLFSQPSVIRIHEFLKKHPRIKLITGISTNIIYPKNAPHSSTARPFPDKTAWYDLFNTALLMDYSNNVETYHKSKLVPGVEKMPLKFLEQLSIDEGGASGSLGSQDTPTVFKINDTLKAAPVICYESIFGDHVRQFVKKGADVITIITNDGWWKNSPGYMQHLYFGSLRAIETRRFMVRSANTGVSCFVLPSGKIIQPTEYWVPAAIKAPLIINHSLTFYTKYGDYIGWAAVWLGAFFFIFLVISAFFKPKKQLK